VHPRGIPLDLIYAVEWASDKSLFPLVAFIFFYSLALAASATFRVTDSPAIIARGRREVLEASISP